MLSKNRITIAEIDKSEKLLNEFADEFEYLYGKDAITMNIHMLRHYGHVVRKGGPLWSQSMFSFESCIGYYLKSVIAPVHGIDQIAENYCLKQNFASVNKNNKTEMKGVKKIELSSEIKEVLLQYEINSIRNKFLIGDSVNINGYKYNSMMKKNANFFEMKNESIGSAEFYINFNNSIYLLMNQYEIIETQYHLSVARRTNELRVYKIDEIKSLKLYLKYGMKEIVTQQPHYFEET